MRTWVGRLLGAVRASADVNIVEVAISDLDPAFDGYRIAVLADLHQPPNGDVRWLRHVVDATNAMQPDLIALLGDYAYSVRRRGDLSRRWYESALGAMTHELRRLRASDGLVAVLGNHDYYADARLVREWLGTVGAHVLVNGVRCVTRDGQSLRILGLDDLNEGTVGLPPDFDANSRTPTVVMAHNPDITLVLDARIRCDVVVAGHTHGGQIVLPVYGAPLTMARVCKRQSASGWVPNGRAPLYVTRGLGEQWPLPMRINCPPEIPVLRLRSSQQPA